MPSRSNTIAKLNGQGQSGNVKILWSKKSQSLHAWIEVCNRRDFAFPGLRGTDTMRYIRAGPNGSGPHRTRRKGRRHDSNLSAWALDGRSDRDAWPARD